MVARTSRFKIGVLVVVGAVAIVLATLGLGIELLHRDTVDFRTYVDESVHGLDLGAPVELRGVPIGEVAKVGLAPDGRHVEVVAAVRAEKADEISRMQQRDATGDGLVLRAQLGSLGITGLKFMAFDLFDASAYPAPELPFAPPPRYVPAAPSLLRSVEAAAMRVSERLPAIVDGIGVTTARIERLVATLEDDEIGERLAGTLERTDEVLRGLDRTLGQVDRAALPQRGARTLDGIGQAMARVNAVLDRIDGDEGLVSSANRAAQAMGELGRGTNRTTRELESAMRGIREASDAIRSLADTLERDPDMLLKGRAKAKAP